MVYRVAFLDGDLPNVRGSAGRCAVLGLALKVGVLLWGWIGMVLCGVFRLSLLFSV